MKNLLRLFAIALIGLSIQCKNTPKLPEVVESTAPKQVLFASDIFQFDLDQRELQIVSQQDSQLTTLRQLATNPKALGMFVEKLGAFQKESLASRSEFIAERSFWKAQELGTRAAIETSTVKPPRIGPPPPPPPPCGAGGGCRLKFDRRRICEILVAISANQSVKLSFTDVAGKPIDLQVKQTSLSAGLQQLSFDLSSMPNLNAGTLNISAFDKNASVGFDVAQF